MSRSAFGRLAAILPEVLSAFMAYRNKNVKSARLIASGLRLGGIFTWGIEQARFSQELAGPKVADVGWQASFPHLPPPAMPGITIVRPLPATETSIVSYQAVNSSAESLRLLISRSAEKETIAADGRLVEGMLSMFPRSLRQISKADLSRLVEDVAAVALVEADLAEEVAGLSASAGSNRFEFPRIVSQLPGILVETDLPGRPLGELPIAERAPAYHAAVTGWTRMLITDGILQVGLRRDRILGQGGRLGITRWAGTRPARATSRTLLRTLVLAAFGADALVRKSSRTTAENLLADGLGLAGDLAQIQEFCFSLVSESGRLDRRPWQQLAGITVTARNGYSSAERTEVLLLLRQLIWLRDLGLECGVEDLAAPWRALAPELEGP
jgi:hypothetical protein